MDSFGRLIWQKLKHFFFIAWFYRSVWTIIAMLTVRSEMHQFSRNNWKNVRSPPEHFAIGNVHSDNLPLGIIALICHSKQLQEGLIVFSDNILHFLKIKKKFVEFTQTVLWLLRLSLYISYNDALKIHTYETTICDCVLFLIISRWDCTMRWNVPDVSRLLNFIRNVGKINEL